MSGIIDQIFEISTLAEFLREDASVLVNAQELTSLTLVANEGWQLGSKIAQLRKESELLEITTDVLVRQLRYLNTLIQEISKNYAQNLALINHITRLSQNLNRMVREITYVEDAQYHGELVIKTRTGYLIDESTFHHALRELSTLFSKLGEIHPNETPTCPLSVLLLQLARLLGMMERTLQANIVYHESPQLLIALAQMREEFQRIFRPIYWIVKQRYFQDEIKNSLQMVDSILLNQREEKKSKKQKDLVDVLKSLGNVLDEESLKKKMPAKDSPLPELK